MGTHVQPAATSSLFLTVPQAADILQISDMMLYRYIWAKKGPRIRRFGRLVRIHRDDLLEWSKKDRPSLKMKV
jgi:excisionase family DNA binding protein